MPRIICKVIIACKPVFSNFLPALFARLHNSKEHWSWYIHACRFRCIHHKRHDAPCTPKTPHSPCIAYAITPNLHLFALLCIPWPHCTAALAECLLS